MKLNRFVHVEIPKNSDFFSRLAGNMPSIPIGMYSGDETPPMNLRKTEQLDYMAKTDMETVRREAAEAREDAQRAEESKGV